MPLLRIIVGVKYCFRYNARQRARHASDADNLAEMQNMPPTGTRPHRRRREKKLMTIDEVNERFPTMKYKAWRAQREAAGLCSSGGVKTEPNSRAPSIREVETTEPLTPVATEDKKGEMSSRTHVEYVGSEEDAEAGRAEGNINKDKRLSEVSVAKETGQREDGGPEHEDEPEAEEIHDVPEDLLKSVGDACAICLDNIEDSDDVRGLTCGHTFHSVCLDPWLTSRRACCPLCKKDYYIPKPKTEAELAAEEAARERRRQNSGNYRQQPSRASSWLGGAFQRRFSGRDERNRDRDQRDRNRERSQRSQTASSEPSQSSRPSNSRSFSERLPTLSIPRPAFMRRSRDNTTSPPDLEAGPVRA